MTFVFCFSSVLLERLVANRPHPWGLLITFLELVRNPNLKLWSREFMSISPDVKRYVLLSCMRTELRRHLCSIFQLVNNTDTWLSSLSKSVSWSTATAAASSRRQTLVVAGSFSYLVYRVDVYLILCLYIYVYVCACISELSEAERNNILVVCVISHYFSVYSFALFLYSLFLF